MSVPGGNLQKLTIIGYKDPGLKEPIGSATPGKYGGDGIFVAPINPASISLSFSTSYTPPPNDTTQTPEVRYKGGNPPNLSFDLVLDGTGVLDNMVSSNPVSVPAQIELFKNACYYYVSTKHDLPYVRIFWGAALASYKNATFAGRLESLKINITLFSPLGVPLRASLSASFLGTMENTESFKLLNRSSPDLTHLIKVKSGDTLPKLCQEIYNDAQMYHQIAKINKLTNFRKLNPGQELEFPPIKQL